MTDTKIALLEPVQESIPVASTGIDPKEFYQNRKGLYVWSGFKDRIVAKAEAVKAEFRLRSFTLKEDANDAKIESALPEKHIFSESDAAAIVADLIEKQPNGEEGVLLNDGNWNLFYTPGCVVLVHWSSFRGGWSVSAWGRDEDGWRAGERIFSPAT